jgi:hypothetical protein
MTNKDVIKLILQTYKIENEVPDDAKNNMFVSRKRNLAKILKKFGKYGFFTSLAIKLLFELRQLGIPVTMAKAYAVIIAGSIAVTGIASTASVVVIKKYLATRHPAVLTDTLNVSPVQTSTPEAKSTDDKSVSPLKRQYEKYKHMEKVTLKDGTVLIGTLLQKGDIVELVTPNGILTVTKDDIQGIIYLKPEEL